MTASVGFRAPARGRTGARTAGARWPRTSSPRPTSASTAMPAQAATATPGAHSAARCRPLPRTRCSAALRDPQALAPRARRDGSPSPRPQVWFDAPARRAAAARRRCALDRRTRMLYDARHVFINGESFRAGGRDARLLRRLADRRRLGAAEVAAPQRRGARRRWTTGPTPAGCRECEWTATIASAALQAIDSRSDFVAARARGAGPGRGAARAAHAAGSTATSPTGRSTTRPLLQRADRLAAPAAAPAACCWPATTTCCARRRARFVAWLSAVVARDRVPSARPRTTSAQLPCLLLADGTVLRAAARPGALARLGQRRAAHRCAWRASRLMRFCNVRSPPLPVTTLGL